MSKISLVIDTKDNTITCKLDGGDIPNVTGAYIYCGCNCDGDPKVSVDISVEAEEIGTGVKKYSRIVTASEKLAAGTIQGTSPDATIAIVNDSPSILSGSITKLLGR